MPLSIDDTLDLAPSSDISFTGSAQSLILTSALGQLGKDITPLGVDLYWHMYHRYQLNLPKSNITRAILKLYRYDPLLTIYDFSLTDIIVRAYIEATDSSVAPVTWNDADTKLANHTADQTDVTFTPPPSADGLFVEIDLKAHIQSIVNRAGWASGNYIGIYLQTVAPTAGGNANVVKYYTNSIFTGSPFIPVLTIQSQPAVTLPVSYNKYVEDAITYFQLINNTLFSKNSADDLSITDIYTTVLTRGRDYTDDFEILDTVRENRTIVIDYFEPLSFDDYTDLVASMQYSKVFNDDLTLIDDISRNKPKEKDVYDIFAIEQDQSWNEVYSKNYEDMIEFDDYRTTNVQMRSIIDTILIEQDLSKSDFTRKLKLFEELLDVTQTIVVTRSLTNKTVNDDLTLTDVCGRFE